MTAPRCQNAGAAGSATFSFTHTFSNEGYGGHSAVDSESVLSQSTFEFREPSNLGQGGAAGVEGVVPVLGLLSTPRSPGAAAFRNVDIFVRSLKPSISVLAEIGAAARFLWAGAASLLGGALGHMIAGPAPALAALKAPSQGLDDRMDRAQKILSHEEMLGLRSYLSQNPDAERRFNLALAEPSILGQREALLAIGRQVGASGPGSKIGTPPKNFFSTWLGGLTPQAASRAKDGGILESCPNGMVYTSKQETGLPWNLCVDEDDYPDPLHPHLPMVKDISVQRARALCAQRQARLFWSFEYTAVASFGRKKIYPTRDGTARGIHYLAHGPRPLKLDPENNFLQYTQPDGGKKTIFNLSGNVWELLDDGSVAGGAWTKKSLQDIQINKVLSVGDDYVGYSGVTGFRCVSDPIKSSEDQKP